MHLDIMTRGPKWYVDNIITQLQGVYLPWEIKKDGTAGLKKGNYQVQMRVCPVQLWDLSFPEQHLHVVINSLLQNKGKPMNSKYQKFVSMLRLGMGLKKIPKFKPTKLLPMSAVVQHTEMIGIGIKPDRFEDGTEML